MVGLFPNLKPNGWGMLLPIHGDSSRTVRNIKKFKPKRGNDMLFHSSFPDILIPEVPFHSFILQNVQEWKDKPAFIDGSTGRTLTFGQVANGARLAASSLAKRRFKKGDVFAIYSPNIPEYAIAFHAIIMLGGIVTTINPLYTVDELVFQLKDTNAKYLITVPPFVDKALEAAQKSHVEEVFVFGEAEGATPFASLLKSDGQLPEVNINPREDMCAIPYSSGTGGLPKGVMLTHYNFVAATLQAENVVKWTFDENSHSIAVLPFYHIYGMVINMNRPIHTGRLVITLPRFDLEQFLQLIQDHAVTHLALVPPIVLALAKHPLVEKYDLSSLKLINSSAASLGTELQQQCAQRIGCMVTQGYGMTEACAGICAQPDEPSKIRVGSVGLLLPNMEAKVLDVKSGAELGPNENGEITVRGPNLMQGYLNNAEATAHTIDQEGWLHTGDIGHFDNDGYIFIVDRVKELIKYKGFQVAPAELEAVLLSHPAIADAAVIGTPDEEAGELPKAFVVTRAPISADEIITYVAERVAPYKKIHRVEMVDQIPKSASGKILHRVLVEHERAAVKH
jgi:acyl-CoA synthetase (AMP-forming)/AMP-acid ligase II